jgi:hypothetical protein
MGEFGRPKPSRRRGEEDQDQTPPEDSWTMSWPNQGSYQAPPRGPVECEGAPYGSPPSRLPEWREGQWIRARFEKQTFGDLRWLAEHAGLNEFESIDHAVQLYRRLRELATNDVEIVIRRGDGEAEVLDIP